MPVRACVVLAFEEEGGGCLRGRALSFADCRHALLRGLVSCAGAGDLEALINFVYEGNAAVAVAEEVAETSRLAAAASAAEGGAAAERLGSAASEAAANARASLSAAVPIHVAAAATAAAAASAAAAAVCAAPAKTGTPRSEARELRNSPLAQVSSEAAAAAAAAAASCCFSSWHVWRLLLDVIFGLQHLHNAGVVYRDMKPSNVLLDCPGALRAEEALFASPPSSPAASAQPMGVDAAADCAAAEAGPEDSKEGGGARASGSRKAWPSSQEDAGGGGAPEVAVPPMQRIRAVLADFGTAARCGYTRASSGEKGGALRRDRGFSGTVEFTAPELFGSEEEHVRTTRLAGLAFLCLASERRDFRPCGIRACGGCRKNPTATTPRAIYGVWE